MWEKSEANKVLDIFSLNNFFIVDCFEHCRTASVSVRQRPSASVNQHYDFFMA